MAKGWLHRMRHHKMVLALGAMAALLLVVPTWSRTEDSGRISCGSVLFKSDFHATWARTCEANGIYTDRILVTAVIAVNGMVLWLLKARRQPDRQARRRSSDWFLLTTVVFAAVFVALWFTNNDSITADEIQQLLDQSSTE